MKVSTMYDRRAKDVAAFRDLYAELVSQTGHWSNSSGGTKLGPRRGTNEAKEEFKDLRRKVARAAGAAVVAAKDFEVHAEVTSEFGGPATADPIRGWQHSLDNPDRFPPSLVIECCEGVVGKLEGKAAEARAREGSLVGRVASFAGFPARVRQAVAAEHPDQVAAQRIGFGVGILGQVFAGVLATGVVAILVIVYGMVT